eukprot:383102_1
MAQLPLGHFHFLSTHVVESIIVVVATLLFLFWSRPKPDPIRRETHEGLEVQIISDVASLNNVINELLQQSKHTLLGLDCEWTPSMPQFHQKQYKIGLFQLATDTTILLIRLNKMNYVIPESLQSLLTNDKILKCGVGIHQDVTKIFRDYGIKTMGVIELNDIYKLSSYFDPSDMRTKSLKTMYQITCGQSMKYKHKTVTLSHWNSYDALTMPQVHYAADDALVGQTMFIRLMEDIFGIIDCDEYRIVCAEYIDVMDIKAKKEKTENDKQSLHKQKMANQRKADRIRAKRNNCTPNTRRYKVLKPDGSVLFKCGKFRCEWFVANQLAETVDDTSCKLVFKHCKWNERSKDNACFVCGVEGTDDNEVTINRFNILPTCYWKCLRNEEIQQRSLIGNTIAVCFKKDRCCATKARQSRIDCMQYLCDKYPNVSKHPELLRRDASYNAAKKAANALNGSHLIPMERQIELVQVVADYCGLEYDGDILHLKEDEVFGSCLSDLLKSEKEQTEFHVNALLDHYKRNEKVFVELWRAHFCKTMKPQFVPSYWPLQKLSK